MARRQITYALCIDNKGYEAALELRKLYQIVPPEKNDPANWLRIIDESGEDYLYSGVQFVVITLPREVERVVEATL
ncbi:MAG: hypothetical protein H0W76_03740 [Pyrinomonadaceae bacterium]|nr:hypothetical protein [Pyrinomonadaceae bacterium]